MNLYFSINVSVCRRYENLGRRLIGLGMNKDKSSGWKAYFVKQSDPKLSEYKNEIAKAACVVVGADVMRLCPAVYKVLCAAIRRAPCKSILCIGDMVPAVMASAKSGPFDLVIGTNGYRLPLYTTEPAVYMAHPALVRPLTLAPQIKVFVPMFHGCAVGSYRPTRTTIGFYPRRRALGLPLVNHPHVVFQTREILGDDFQKTLGSYLACVTAVPSNNQPNLICKLWEIMAAGSLLIADTRPFTNVFKTLGFVHGVHYLETTPETIVETVEYVVDPHNRAAINKMRAAGHDEVRAHHQPKHRIDQYNYLVAKVTKEAA